MLWDHAQFEGGGFGVELSIQRLLDRMRTGCWLVMENLKDWFEEFRIFHRKNGQVVKERDDLMAASRYMEMMLRYAKEPGQGKFTAYKGQPLVYDNRGIV